MLYRVKIKRCNVIATKCFSHLLVTTKGDNTKLPSRGHNRCARFIDCVFYFSCATYLLTDQPPTDCRRRSDGQRVNSYDWQCAIVAGNWCICDARSPLLEAISHGQWKIWN